MLFLDDWCTYTKSEKIDLYVNCTADDVELAAATATEVLASFATKRIASYLGAKPAFCLSGGIDSQAAYQLWDKKFPIDVVIFEFADGLNSDEVADAKRYVSECNIPHKIITLNVERFLTFNMVEFARKHKILSPQFATHAFFLEHLKSQGYTGAVFGGNGLVNEESKVYFSLITSQFLDLENYSKSGFNVVSNFLAADKHLCLKLALNTPVTSKEDAYMLHPDHNVLPAHRHMIHDHTVRYLHKIKSYENLNLKIIPQTEKKTGFEQIKSYYENKSNDLWAFERYFRWPLRVNGSIEKVNTVIDPDVERLILDHASKLDH